MSALVGPPKVDATPGFPGVYFGVSADDINVALVGEHAFAMSPTCDGRFYLATGWRIRRPMEEWTRSDFYGHSGELADDAAFRTKVLEQAQHQCEKAALDRRDIRSMAHTPWGQSQGATLYAEGVLFHSTASHGGFHLSADRNRKVHAMLRIRRGFYEEDEAWAIVAITFPHLFTTFERVCAEASVTDSYPDAWEAITGRTLEPGESRKKDERAFFARHAAEWIVQSAIRSEQNVGFTEVIATLGGRHGIDTERRRFLIPSDEYRLGRFGFVIDPVQHPVYSGPSSFASWQAEADS